MKSIFVVIFFFGFTLGSHAQTDTTFWFVAPEVAQAHSDRPIAFRLTSGATACSVRVYTPADPSIYDNTVYIPPQTVISLDLTPQINLIENDPPNQVLNRGFKIQSTAEITAYYEVISAGNNTDIFALKGETALGSYFLMPGQRSLNNIHGHERIDVVATENNTTIQFTPTADLFQTGGGVIPAGTLVSVTLNAGQTYCFRANSQAANISLAGSTLTSDRPVAVTYIDDSVLGTALGGGGCHDLLGDQLIPVNILGNEFIVIKGYLTNADLVTVTALTNNTQVSINGVAQAALAAGQTLERIFTENVLYITSSQPVNVMHVSGYGCETGMAILPPIQCTGSQSVGFQRTTPENFAINLITKTQFISGFMLNGIIPIPASIFQPVPGTGGQWQYARAEYSGTGTISPNNAYVLSNSLGKFHMGLINGGASSGCRYGYFSDYARFPVQASTNFTPMSPGCPGDLLRLFADTLAGASYTWRRPDGQFFSNLRNPTVPGFSPADTGLWTVFAIVDGCSSAVRQVSVAMGITPIDTLQENTCDSIRWNGTTYRQSGYYPFTTTNRYGCDSTVVLELAVRRSTSAVVRDTACDQYTWALNGRIYTSGGLHRDTVMNVQGCDSVATLFLTLNRSSLESDTARGCDQYVWRGQTLTATGVYFDSLTSRWGCDSVLSLRLIMDETPAPPLGYDTTVCLRLNLPLTYSGSFFGEMRWYADSLLTRFLGIGPVHFLNELSDTVNLYAVFRSQGGCISPVARFRAINEDSRFVQNLPTAFSPNNDRLNDVWEVQWDKEMSLEVFDRWGRLVARDAGTVVRWDGSDLPPGVYPYILRYPVCSGGAKSRTGVVHLIK
jgi:gliding motility-associated-like protein